MDVVASKLVRMFIPKNELMRLPKLVFSFKLFIHAVVHHTFIPVFKDVVKEHVEMAMDKDNHIDKDVAETLTLVSPFQPFKSNISN